MNEFQQKALLSVAFDKKDAAALAHRTLGVAGEAGELANTEAIFYLASVK